MIKSVVSTYLKKRNARFKYLHPALKVMKTNDTLRPQHRMNKVKQWHLFGVPRNLLWVFVKLDYISIDISISIRKIRC